MSNVKSYLCDLINNLRNSENNVNLDAAHRNLSKIKDYFYGDITSIEAEFTLKILFADHEGIVDYAKELIKLNSTAVSKIITDILFIFLQLLESFRSSMTHYVTQIMDLCTLCNVAPNSNVDISIKTYQVYEKLLEFNNLSEQIDIPQIIGHLDYVLSSKKVLPTKRQHLYSLFGVIAKHHPIHLINYKDKLVNLFFNELQIQADACADNKKSRTFLAPVAIGCLCGLTGFLTNFSDCLEINDNSLKLYKMLKILIGTVEDKKKHVVNRSALNLFQKHIELFLNIVFKSSDEIVWFQKKLWDWCTLSNVEDKKIGLSTFEFFYKGASRELQNNYYLFQPELKLIQQNNVQIMIHFLKSKMCDSKSSFQIQAAIIRSIGWLSEPYNNLLGQNHLKELFITLIMKAEEKYLSSKFEEQNKDHFAACYLNSLSLFMKNINYLSCDQLSIIQKLSIYCFDDFASTHSHSDLQDSIKSAIIISIYCLALSHKNILESYLNQLFYMALIKSCSHRAVVDAEFIKDCSGHTIITFTNYVPIWISLLKADQCSIYDFDLKIPLHVKRSLSATLLQVFMSNILKVVAKLDLRINKTTELDKETAFNPSDYTALLNLVQLFNDIMLSLDSDTETISTWLPHTLTVLIERSMELPTASSLYKLLTVIFKVINGDSSLKDNNFTVKKIIVEYVNGTMIEVHKFKGDLQFACLEMFMSLPPLLIKEMDNNQIMDIMKLTFTVGASYLPLAKHAVSALQRWQLGLSKNEIDPILKYCMPYIDLLLRTKGYENEAELDSNVIDEIKIQTLKKRKLIKRNKLIMKPETELEIVQNQILEFLAHLDITTCLNLLEKSENEGFYPKDIINYKLSFSDCKINISFDNMLPRILELSQGCSNRQTRVIACEIFHAYVTLYLGLNLQLEPLKPTEMKIITRKIIPIILKLACDVDNLVKHLFEPLAFGIVHYFSSKIQTRSIYTPILIDILMDSICDDSNPAIRDFSAKCIKEFIQWTLKQNDTNSKLPYNINLILMKIKQFCMSTDPYKQLGSAIAFNSCYTILRKDETIINEIWIPLLFCFVLILDSNNAILSKEDVIQSLDHLEKVFLEKSDIFNESCLTRIAPQEMSGSQLINIVEWLYKYSSSPITACRQRCFKMAKLLAEKVKGHTSLKTILDLFLPENVKLIDSIERNLKIVNTLIKKSDATSEEISFMLIDWLEQLIASLECYTLLFQDNILDINLISNSNHTSLFHSIDYFSSYVEEFSLKQWLENARIQFKYDSKHSVILSNKFNSLKNNVIIALFYFVCSLDNHYEQILSEASIQQLYSITIKFIFGSNVIDYIEKSNLTKYSFVYYIRMVIKSQGFINKLQQFFVKEWSSIIENLNSLSEHNLPIKFIRGIRLLDKCEVFSIEAFCSIEDQKQIQSLLFQNICHYGIAVKFQPIILSFVEDLMDLSFKVNCEIEKLIEQITDPREITEPDTNSKLHYGQYFFQVFKKPLTKHILKTFPDKFIYEIFVQSTIKTYKILYIIVNLLKEAKSNQLNAQSLIEKVINNEKYWLQLKDQLSWDEIFELVQLSSLLVDNFRNEKFAFFQNWVCEQITNNKLNVYQKCQLLGLLPQLVSKQTCIIEPFDNVIRKCLMNFRDNVFPMTSTTKLQKEDNIKLVFNKILIAMELCSSCLLFEIIVEWCIKDPKHPCVNCVKKYLQLFFKRLNKENQVYCCTFIYNKFISEYLSEDRRHMVADIFLIPLITYCKKDAALHMYSIMMEFILKTNNENLLANCSGKARNLLISKITCFKLVEEMFRFFSTTEINCPTIIPYSLTQTQSKSLLIHFRNSAVKLRNIAVQYTSESREIHLLRLLHCNAYNMLVTIISNTAGNDVHVFSMFLFYEHLPKTCIWKHLLDNDKHYEIPIDFEMLPQRRKILINIQRKMNKNNSSENYINFQTYLRSSLADEFDFNNVSLRSSLSLDDDLYHSNSQLFSQPVSVELELDDFNNHECMAHLCAVIAHMASVTDHGTESCTDMPEWMNYLKLSFCQDSSKDKNFKMFLMKLIVNCESYFEPYAKQWLSPIMKFILEKQLGNSMNYFLADVVTMLVSWKTSAIPSTNEEKNLAKKLLCFLLSVSKTEVKNVFKHNIELIKLLVENWKQSLEMEYDVLLHLIKPDTTNNIWSECGLHLVGIITANGILPFSIHNNKIFFNILLDNLKNNYPGIYVTSSELLGMILKIVDETLIIETDLVNNVTSTIKLKENSNITKMLSCLYSIQKHYSKILISYMNDLFKIFKNLHGHHRTQCLEMFSNGLDLIDRPFEQLSHLHGFFDIIKDSDSEDQLICLNIILNLVKSLKAEDLILLINSIVEIPNQNNRNHRKQVYEIMKTAHKIHIGHMNNESKQITEVCKKCLLTGLMDNDKELRKEVFRYWADDEKLPLKCIDRLLKLMNQLYLPNTESNFLGNLVSILLESCCTASDYEQNIFQHPLHVCKFENYKFIASWRAQHLSSVPIYADTIASQINQSNTHEYSTSVHGTMFQIKRTMTFQFEPTEYEFSSNNMSVQDLCSSSTLNSTDSSTNNIVLEANDQKKGTSDFIQKQQRRILHSKQLQSKIHAMKNIQINENRDIFKKERAQKREANVNMFREYRIGDFPDIEITNSSIIKPLIELAKRDNGISRTVLSSIMSGLKDHIINKHSFFESLNNSLAKMVNDCHYNTSFVGFILDTAFCYPSEIHINICRVTEAAISSGLLSMGALVIESSINSLESENLDVQPGKKTKPNENLDDAWIKLAELYKNIGELDVVEGIFQDKINKISCELLQEGLKAEQSKDWRLAQSKFHSVIESYSQNSILTNDTFFLFEEYYKCSEYLSDWKEINRVLKLQAGNNYERIWDSNWNKIHLLPRVLNSELHNIYARQSDGKFIDIFNEWLSNFEKEEHILTNTAPQASMIYLCCNEFKKAQLYCKHRMRNFLHEWANIDPQYDKLRAERLLDLQTVSEIYCYTLSLLTKPIDNLKSICDQIKMWQSKLPVKSDSIILWDTKILYRSFFLSKIKESNNNLSIEEKTSLTQLIREYEMQSTLAFVECAINQNNFYVAKKYMNKLQNKNNINNWMSDVTLCHSKVLSMYTWYTTKPEKKLKYYIDSLSELDKINKQQCSPICLIKMHTHIADISTNIHTIFYESTNTEQIDHSLKIQVNQKLNIKSEMSDPHGIIHQIDSNVIENLKYAINIALCNKVSNNIIIDAYLKLAQHCLKEFDTQGNDKNIHKLSLFVESILKSMKYGGKKAWILFPLVLQQNLTNNTLKEIFIKESQDLPEYMLLEWIDQILGCLDSPLISVFGTLLISIAKIYPKALQYPLRVYMEKDVYKFHETQEFLKTKY
ncbi:DNA-dependent protein kinase catalytic subunit-like isoform X2 [Adelges cooleyi]|uniref:DNA-dependent protein kinase catalytic subunit-like isoform X2 n=1 Tax=Adelges cooleyi TaxID=133065 RepID=UPI00217F6A04|nr:DNA-dependent protein kinase catalytic subunit-like isoform X2 [Adelges cooleyi]